MRRTLSVILVLLAGAAMPGLPLAASSPLETRHLITRDATGSLSQERLSSLTGEAQAALERILLFWAADAGTARHGKIHVVFDRSRKRGYSWSVFYWSHAGGRRVRVVHVFGVEGPPQEMVHKLTSAVFPHPDKLIRNMMGVPTEERLGNPLTFPGCGFSTDDWVRAFLKTKASIPMRQLGPDHESWGMRTGGDGLPVVFDRALQSRAYATAGSFGNHLIQTHGIDKMKQFHALSQRDERPWQAVFGMTLEELEAQWLQRLQTEGAGSDASVSILAQLFEENPNLACLQAQRLVARGRAGGP